MASNFFQNEFDPDLFDQHLSSKLTYRVIYRKARVCPCRAERSGSTPDPKCPVCNGDGYYLDPVPAASTHSAEFYWGGDTPPALPHAEAAITSVIVRGQPFTGTATVADGLLVLNPAPPQRTLVQVTYTAPAQGRMHAASLFTRRDLVERGIVETGDLEATIPAQIHTEQGFVDNPAYMAAQYDRFILPDITRRIQQHMVRGKQERVQFSRIKRILECRARIGSTIQTYTATVANGMVQFAGDEPPAQTPYVLEYEASPVYVVHQDLLRLRHIDGKRLPRSVHLRLVETSPGIKV